MPNPSTLQRSLSDQYEDACDRANDLRYPKAYRELALREARRLAEELGIEGPPPVNGQPVEPQPLPINALAVTSSIERQLIRDALVYYGILADGREEVRASLIRRLS